MSIKTGSGQVVVTTKASTSSIRPTGYEYPVGLSRKITTVGETTEDGADGFLENGENKIVKVFISTSPFSFSNIAPPSSPSTINVEYMAIAGGGGAGGAGAGGGGGAGGFSLGYLDLNKDDTYTFTVGAGGAPTARGANTSIQNSSNPGVNLVFCEGGGRGGPASCGSGQPGGSGGGSGGCPGSTGCGLSTSNGQGTPGFRGATSGPTGTGYGGGGGGGVGTGGTGNDPNGNGLSYSRSGGNGLSISWSPPTYGTMANNSSNPSPGGRYFAGGGAGFPSGSGGIGGGRGELDYPSFGGTNTAVAYTGSGAYFFSPGSGADGIIMIKTDLENWGPAASPYSIN